MRIGMFAGEASGDVLGGELIRQIKESHPQTNFFGIGGNHMIEQGLDSLYPMQDFAVMGISEPILKLPFMLRARRDIALFLREAKIDIFIGIDFPDFNFGLERMLRESGIKTVHYVSPSVWAWRTKRVQKVARSADVVLCLLPFEMKYYQQQNIASYFVGHLAVERIKPGKKQKLQMAILPGSRVQEIKHYAPLFSKSLKILQRRHPEIEPMVLLTHRDHQMLLGNLASLPIHIGKTEKYLAQTEVALVASGTASLEAFLAGNKAVSVASSKSRLFTWLVERFVLPNTAFFSLPNILLGKTVVRECITKQARAEYIAEQLEQALVDTNCYAKSRNKVIAMLRAEKSAADIILELCS